MDNLPFGGSTAAVVLALAVAIAILMRRSYRYFGRARKTHGQPVVYVERPGAKQPVADAPDNLLRWQVEMHETARDLSARLDSKMIALGHLIHDARVEAARLEQLLQAAGQLDSPSAATEEFTPIKGIKPAPPSDPQHAEIHALADQGLSAATIAHRVKAPLEKVTSVLKGREERRG